MKLGTKFVFLIVGAVLTPILAMALMTLLAFVSFPESVGVTETVRTTMAISKLRHQRVEPWKVIDVIRAAAPDNDALVFDRDKRVLYSSLRTNSLLTVLLDEKRDVHTFTREIFTAPDGSPFYVVIGFHSGDSPRPWFGRLAFTIAVGSLVGFMTIMSLLIIRSINASIARLVVATRRISAGDLDFQLPVDGRDSIGALTRSFEQMRRRVRADAEARSRFIMSVSHDLKTPLSSISGYLDAIEDGMAQEPGQLEKYLAIIRDKTGLLESRISQLIDYVKLETGDWKKSREPIALKGFLMEAMTVFGSEAEVRGFTFETAIDLPPSLVVPMDGDLVFRALENLVQNAFRYADPGSTIRFGATIEGSSVRIDIANRGAIAEKDLPFIFEPFYKGSRSRREAGFGLGLSVVKWVTSSHGWLIDVVSRDGDTTFAIRIPLVLSASRK
ncbi:MAG TPA: HAMP domain-containing sensor histidine kinase [Spirochaetia bacterium]